jgi:hypothetical protein
MGRDDAEQPIEFGVELVTVSEAEIIAKRVAGDASRAAFSVSTVTESDRSRPKSTKSKTHS